MSPMHLGFEWRAPRSAIPAILLRSTSGFHFQRPAAIDVAKLTYSRLVSVSFPCSRVRRLSVFVRSDRLPISFGDCRAANRRENGQCTVTAFHPGIHRSQRIDFTTGRLLAAQHRNPKRSSGYAGRSCDGLPNACQIAHNNERLAKNGGSKVVACRPRHPLDRDSRVRVSHLFY
jgi:hypothetical protein